MKPKIDEERALAADLVITIDDEDGLITVVKNTLGAVGWIVLEQFFTRKLREEGGVFYYRLDCK